jgi:peptidylprolyl isomerase
MLLLLAGCIRAPEVAETPQDNEQPGQQTEEGSPQREEGTGSEETDSRDEMELDSLDRSETYEVVPATVRPGDTVIVHCTGTLENGEVFDSYEGDTCLQFKVGSSDLLPAFEEAVIGMEPGETRTFTISAEEAYGPHHDALVFHVDRNDLPEDKRVEPGEVIHFTHDTGFIITAVVVDIVGSNVTVDANHPLAGEDLTFEVELVKIVG